MEKLITSVPDIIEALSSAINYWIDVHTKPECWAEEITGYYWDTEEFLRETVKHEDGWIGTDIWSIDLYSCSLLAEAKDRILNHSITYCSLCGQVNTGECGEFDCECEADHPYIDESTISLLVEELKFRKHIPSEEYIIEALEGPAFEEYRDQVHPLINEHIENCISAMLQLEECETNQDRVVWILKAVHLQHYSGRIIEFIDEGLSHSYVHDIDAYFMHKLVYDIADNGISAFKDLVEKYVAEDELCTA